MFRETTVKCSLFCVDVSLNSAKLSPCLSLSLVSECMYSRVCVCVCVFGGEILIMLTSNNHLQVQKENILLWAGLQELLFA